MAGYATAVVLYFIKQSAQTNRDSVASAIVAHGGGAGSCVNTPASSPFASACSAFISDTNDVNTDASAGNVALVVGLLATAAAVPSMIYWLTTRHSEAPKVTLMPVVGPSIGGLSIGGQF